MSFPRAVLFDLLTALLDSWTLWDSAAGSQEAGRAWRAEYLRLTYGSDAYVPYEQLVRDAARATGLPDTAPNALEARWLELSPWSGAAEAVGALRGWSRLAVVTNCSIRLGRLAAGRLAIAWGCVMTAEEAGYYKPNPRPYWLALERLGVQPAEAAFVAGSGYDLIGTSAVGLRTYWHNREGLRRPEHAPLPQLERPTFDDLIPWLEGKI